MGGLKVAAKAPLRGPATSRRRRPASRRLPSAAACAPARFHVTHTLQVPLSRGRAPRGARRSRRSASPGPRSIVCPRSSLPAESEPPPTLTDPGRVLFRLVAHFRDDFPLARLDSSGATLRIRRPRTRCVNANEAVNRSNAADVQRTRPGAFRAPGTNKAYTPHGGLMSISHAIAPHLPYLRRFARALAGNQKSGDAYVVAALEAPRRGPRLVPTRRCRRKRPSIAITSPSGPPFEPITNGTDDDVPDGELSLAAMTRRAARPSC